MTPASRRLPWLDVLRAAAVLWVIGYHAAPPFLLTAWPALHAFLGAGFAGVDLFFVLSGYLIGGIALRELESTGTLSLRRFYWRRWMRTLPAYYAVLVLMLVMDLFVPNSTGLAGMLWSYLVFLQPYVVGTPLPRFSWSWSLCTEEYFYLGLPIALLLARHLMPKLNVVPAMQGVALLVLLATIAARQLMALGAADSPEGLAGLDALVMMSPHTRLDGLAIGILLATIPALRHWSTLCTAAPLGVALLICALASPASNEVLWLHRPLLLALGFGLLVAVAVGEHSWHGVTLPGARGLAELSYALYLVHPIVRRAVELRLSHLPEAVQFLIFVLTTIVASLGLRYGVELPGLWLRDHLSTPRPQQHRPG